MILEFGCKYIFEKLQGFLRIVCSIFIKRKQVGGAVQNPY
jgi:hypothetical protein